MTLIRFLRLSSCLRDRQLYHLAVAGQKFPIPLPGGGTAGELINVCDCEQRASAGRNAAAVSTPSRSIRIATCLVGGGREAAAATTRGVRCADDGTAPPAATPTGQLRRGGRGRGGTGRHPVRGRRPADEASELGRATAPSERRDTAAELPASCLESIICDTHTI